MAQGNAAGALAGAGKFTELRQRLLFVLGALIVYRIGCFIPVPGVNPDAMLAMMQAQGGGIVDMFNMFSGGALHRFSIFALNVMPYISASIVMQLGVHIFPSLKALQKEGESGRRKITQYSRIGAVLLAVVQGGSIATALQNQVAPGGMPVVYAPGMGFVLTAVVALTAGTIFLMWVGEQVTERGIGNGVSLIIFAGIVAVLPGTVARMFGLAQQGQLSVFILLLITLIAVATVVFIVFMERAQRRLLIQYPKRQEGNRMAGGERSFLPLKVNTAGVIPPIFASSLLMLPTTVAQFTAQANLPAWLEWLPGAAGCAASGSPPTRTDPADGAHAVRHHRRAHGEDRGPHRRRRDGRLQLPAAAAQRTARHCAGGRASGVRRPLGLPRTGSGCAAGRAHGAGRPERLR